MSADVTIIIVNWNTRDLLDACLTSIAAHAPDALVCVVDNASSDDSINTLKPRYPTCRWIASPDNLGFARANNLVLREVNTPYVWLLNPDTEITPNALETLVAYLHDHPDVAVVGPQLLNPDGSLQDCAFDFATPWRVWAQWLYLPGPIARWRDRLIARPLAPTTGPADWVLGAAMLIRSAAITTVGVLNDCQFMYAEEMDWCLRFRKAGYATHLVTEARVMHHGGGATRQVPDAMLLELFKAQTRYFNLHHSWGDRLVWRMLLLIGGVWNAIYAGLRSVTQTKPITHLRIARLASPFSGNGQSDI